jgi:phthiodiolone/phenolphthiodiolone dimycocerosates ketoreductase
MKLELDLPIFYLRHLPPTTLGDAARGIAASGVINSVTVWDQLTFHVPPALWKPEYTPLARALPDIDSMPEAMACLGYIAAVAPELGLTTSPDAVRRGPGELMQAMLTIADFTQGRATFQMGAGEIKQTGPFGHKTQQGLKRLEDQLRIYREFLSNSGPIDYDGHVWKLHDAWLGNAYAHKPRLMALGGGPKLVDLATSYADGFSTLAPCVWNTPEACAEQINDMRQALERKGRDPREFTFGMWVAAMIHEDDDVLTTVLASPVIQWMTACWGRINPNDWDDKEGIPSPMPRDWHYSRDMRPITYSEDEALDIARRATPEMSRKAWFCGSPADVASRLVPYIEAGVSFVHIGDLLPLALPLEEAPGAMQRSIATAAAVRRLVSEGAPSAPGGRAVLGVGRINDRPGEP